MAINALAYGADGEIIEVAVQEAGTTGGSFGLAGVTAVSPLAATGGAVPQLSWYPTGPVNMNNQALLNARLEPCTTAGRPSGLGPADKGRFLYDTDINRFIVWSGSAWLTALDGGLAAGKILVGDGSGQATARTLSGDITVSNTGLVTVTGLRGVLIEAAPSVDGYVLGYDLGANTLRWVENVAATASGISVDVLVHAPANLAGFTVVNMYPGSSYPNAQPAASDSAHDLPASGISLGAISAGAEGTIRSYGSVTGFSGLVPGLTYYLNPAAAGGITGTAPTGAGQKLQIIGTAVDSVTLFVDIKPRITLVEAAPANSVNVVRVGALGDLQQVPIPTRLTARTGPRFPKTFAVGDLFYHSLLKDFFSYFGLTDALWQSAGPYETMISPAVTVSGSGTLAGLLMPFPGDQDKLYLESMVLRARQAATFGSSDYWTFQPGFLPTGFTSPVTEFSAYGGAVSSYSAGKVAGVRYPYHTVVNALVDPAAAEVWAYKAVSSGAPGALSLDYVTIRYRRIGTEPVAGSYAEAVYASGPLAYWRFNEAAGARVAYDYSGYENPGAIDTGVTSGAAGPTLSGETTNGAFSFPYLTPGARVTAAVPQVPGTTGSAVTLEFWMNITSPSGTPSLPSPTFRPLVSFGGGLALCFYGDQDSNFKFGFTTGLGDIYGTATWSGLTGTWVHVMAVCYRSAPYSNKIYINGAARTLTSLTLSASGSTAANSPDPNLTIGTYAVTPVLITGQALAEVALYGTALSVGDAVAHYAAH